MLFFLAIQFLKNRNKINHMILSLSADFAYRSVKTSTAQSKFLSLISTGHSKFFSLKRMCIGNIDYFGNKSCHKGRAN